MPNIHGVGREAQDLGLDADGRRELQKLKARRVADPLLAWLECALARVPRKGSATAKAILYSLRRWSSLTRYLGDGTLPIDNNCVENPIRPVALGRNNWVFAGSPRAGRRAAVLMSWRRVRGSTGTIPTATCATCSRGSRTRPSIIARNCCLTCETCERDTTALIWSTIGACFPDAYAGWASSSRSDHHYPSKPLWASGRN